MCQHLCSRCELDRCLVALPPRYWRCLIFLTMIGGLKRSSLYLPLGFLEVLVFLWCIASRVSEVLKLPDSRSELKEKVCWLVRSASCAIMKQV